jgi:hypothetical protein
MPKQKIHDLIKDLNTSRSDGCLHDFISRELWTAASESCQKAILAREIEIELLKDLKVFLRMVNRDKPMEEELCPE